MYDKLQGTQGMRHALEEIALSVGEVVHRIRFPRRARTMVRMVNHPIDDRIAEVHVRVCHVDLRAKYHGTFRYLTRVHLLEES